ncbi:MAG: Rrf2 family transcriptional regulator [Clostridia bacterium]|nr:Rrf2 family transcriptional regulator [Clostridia bacterium]
MRITLEADYAVRIIDSLAREGKRLGAGMIAEQTGVTLRFCLKILRKLGQAGLVKSFKGVQGGYELVREPSEITLRDVIEAVDGPILIGRCLDGLACKRVDNPQVCFYHNAFADVSEMVRDKLSSITFAETRK